MAQHHLNHHIHVDATEAKTVTNQFSGGDQANIQLHPGDKVTFTSNRQDAEILYKEINPLQEKTQSGSPFAPDLKPGDRHRVSLATVFTVNKACDFNAHFVFDCGRDLNGVFSVWKPKDSGTPGGSTPGPND
jgi:hypothetical protein